jgi:Outer membrane lipoprotein-sorting protein
MTLLFLVVFVSGAWAAETARQILDRAKALDDGSRWWNDRYQRMQLSVEEGASTRHLELEMYDRREHDRRQQSLIIFLAPAVKAGIALLGHTEGGKPANQWLYTPETRRVRQIAKTGRSNRFDITDFTYHDLDVLTDMPNWSEEEARSKLLDSETIDGVACNVIELEPRLEHVVYGRVLLWLGRDDLVARRVEFYKIPEPRGLLARLFGGGEDDSKQPVRRFRQKDIRNVGSIPVAHRIEVETPAEHTRTTIDVVAVRFDQGLTDAFFSPGSLSTRSR